MFIELHMIQNFGPSCLNRDDTNTPKDCQFGGCRRARISSQSFKRAIRMYFKSQINEFNGKLGVRSRNLPAKIVEFLINDGKEEKLAIDIVKNVIKELGFDLDKKDGKKTDVLLFFNNNIPKKITELILNNWDYFNVNKLSKSTIEKLTPIIQEIKDDLNLDIALFGRMVASKADLNVHAACYVAHAISTHKVEMEMDFYTALDDLQPEIETGAAMMGVIMYNSSCFYRYSVVDVDQLVANLNGNNDFATSVLKGYLEASINAIPTGKQTSMAAFNKPDFILVTIRKDQPWALTNAFAKPTNIGRKNTDLITQSITQLDNYLKDVIKLYGMPDDYTVHFCLLGNGQLEFLDTIGTRNNSIKELISEIGEKINELYPAAS